MATDPSEQKIAAQIAAAQGTLLISGGGTRKQYGESVHCESIVSTVDLTGIAEYQPSELYVTVKAGTLLSDLISSLAAQGQELAFDPPQPAGATVGGMVATGLSGPCRPAGGQVRDHILGCQLIDGSGTSLKFGGQVIKNVAGFDVARLMVGSLGTLGCLTEVTLRVAGKPQGDLSVVLDCPVEQAAITANEAVAHGLPVSASWWENDHLRLRLRGSVRSVERAARELGGPLCEPAELDRWLELRDGVHQRFASDGQIWMCLLPPLARLSCDHLGIHEWLGARRWFFNDAPPDLRAQVKAAGGTAIIYRRGCGNQDRQPVFPHPTAPQLAIFKRLKKVFDKRGLIGTGRLGYL